MYGHLIVFGVCVAVAVGTAVYYYYQEEEKPQRSRTRNRPTSPPPRSRSPPVSYSDIGSQKRKSVSNNPRPDLQSDSEGSNCALVDTLGNVASAPNPAENLNNSQPTQEIANTPVSTTSSAECEACKGSADAIFYPCGHQKLCEVCAKCYFDVFKTRNKKVICPDPNCRKELEYFVVQ